MKNNNNSKALNNLGIMPIIQTLSCMMIGVIILSVTNLRLGILAGFLIPIVTYTLLNINYKPEIKDFNTVQKLIIITNSIMLIIIGITIAFSNGSIVVTSIIGILITGIALLIIKKL